MFFIALIILLMLYLLIIRVCVYSYVKENSLKFEEIVKLNSLYLNAVEHFSKQNTIKYTHLCKSKAEFDRFNMVCFIVSEIETKREEYDNIMQYYGGFYQKAAEYFAEYEKILSMETFDSRIFRKCEENILRKKALRITNEFSVSIKASYTSPQGKNHYESSISYSYHEIEKLYKQTICQMEEKETNAYKVQQERSKMTAGMRYDILKRDGYMCVICGAKSNEHTKLHVDHIKPVSKGGQTEHSNLQTLCERCNLGKSNKI